jgi:hypothetical protein
MRSAHAGEFESGGPIQIVDTGIEAGATFAAPVGGVVVQKDGLLIGFQNLTFTVRMAEGKHELVHI